MEAWIHSTVLWLLHVLALPEIGLSAIFIVSFVSATLLPLGSEPAVLAYLSVAPHMFWAAVVVATVGNTLGGAVSYWMGLGAAKAYETWREKHPHEDDSDQDYSKKAGGRWHSFITKWLTTLGPKALLFSWLPIVGDPLCAIAGWARLPLVPCLIYMAIGKFLRYVMMTSGILWILPHLGGF
ncbi:YqaA family protein [Paenalcaligenes faecalis]|uniref:YqaA family protein n=1 Tax=Paenalcaligenes faecalis TaxID=2980099 RepID=UPI0022B97069|nr:YqaA family protein [Paenalcaligenes faecalis]